MTCPRDFLVVIFCTVLLSVHTSYGSEIIDGKEVKAHSMPFMALLMGKNKTPMCGGTLINPSWVLTAAHCGKIKEVWLGVHSINKTKIKQVRKPKKHYFHPDYDKNRKVNDLMLLKLDKVVKMTQTVNCLNLGASVQDPKAGSSCLVAGWGTTTSKSRKSSDVLMNVNVTVINRAKCKSYYKDRVSITDDMVCAGSDGKNSADSCQGDSGGPLLCNQAIVGVTSFGDGCGQKEKPGVYAFLSMKQLKWIQTTMKKNEI